MVGEFYFLPFSPLIPFALMGFASGSSVLNFWYVKRSDFLAGRW